MAKIVHLFSPFSNERDLPKEKKQSIIWGNNSVFYSEFLQFSHGVPPFLHVLEFFKILKKNPQRSQDDVFKGKQDYKSYKTYG